MLALDDSRPVVRAAASAELLELNTAKALLATMKAAASEQHDLVQAEMYKSALGLGSPAALPLLVAICRSPSRSVDSQLVAARAVFGKGDHSCFAPTANLMLLGKPISDRIGACCLSSQLRDRTAQETALVSTLLQVAITEQDPQIRLEASTGFRVLHDPSAVEPLRTAVLPNQTQTSGTRSGKTSPRLPSHGNHGTVDADGSCRSMSPKRFWISNDNRTGWNNARQGGSGFSPIRSLTTFRSRCLPLGNTRWLGRTRGLEGTESVRARLRLDGIGGRRLGGNHGRDRTEAAVRPRFAEQWTK